jgi:hypothetical protein
VKWTPVKNKILAKLAASAIHAAASAIPVICFAVVLSQLWYPGTLFWADGGAKILVLVTAIDVVLGPLLTFVVYDRHKRSLRNDLIVVIAIQLGALVYGVGTAYTHRPYAIVYSEGQFFAVSAAQIAEGDRASPVETAPGISQSDANPMTYESIPLYVAGIPKDVEEARRMRESILKGATPYFARRALFEPVSGTNAMAKLANREKLEDLEKQNPNFKRDYHRILQKHQIDAQNTTVFTVVCQYSVTILVLDAKNNRVVGMLR